MNTAADYTEGEAPEAPPAQEVTFPSAKEAIATWQLPVESPWSRYEKLTLLTYLSDQPVTATIDDLANLDEVHRAQMAAAHVARAGLPEGTMWVVDLHGAASVAFGVTLSQMARTPVAPVMTFNNWPFEDEVVPAEQALAALATMRPRLPAPEDVGATPVFLLDAYRLNTPYATPDPAAIDNRYMLFPADFPDAATLKAQGITQVVYVVNSRAEHATEQDDFHDVALAYQAEGIELCLVDLADLRRFQEAEESWGVYLPTYRLVVGARVTIFSDPVFYARARGGFGGVRAAPAGAAPRVYSFAHPTVAGVHGGGHSGGHSSAHIGGSSGGRAFSSASPHVGGHGGG